MSDSMVHVRVPSRVKAEAAETLAAMGLTVSGAIRLLLTRVATERALPFDVRVPNAESLRALRELDTEPEKRFSSVDALIADLRADD